MVIWQTQIKYKNVKPKSSVKKYLDINTTADNPTLEWEKLIKELNKLMGKKCDPESELSIYFYGGTPGMLDAVIAYPPKEASLEYSFDFIKKRLENNYAVGYVRFQNYKEISSIQFDKICVLADDSGYIRRWHFDRMNLGFDYFSNAHFKMDETLEKRIFPTLDDIKKACADIMADSSVLEEMERIYSMDNKKEYYGNPVHYKICASNSKAAMDVVGLMVSALAVNNRLCGRRILKIHDINEGCYDESELEHLFETSQGNTVVVEMCGTDENHGNYASSYQQVVDYIESVVEKYQRYTLCFFVEINNNPGFCDSLMSKVSQNLQVIRLNEGYGDRKQAEVYLKNLSKNENIEIPDHEIKKALGNKKTFSVEEIYKIYGKWFRDGLRTQVYKAYSSYNFNEEKTKERTCAPYDELKKMIGLEQVKQMVDEIIDTGRINKLRDSMGMKTHKNSLHMIFTGNPGSAKTTVARLIAQILRKEGLLESGKYVECGRADLISKYVGWTAKNVRAKFREARGGVLFIDEAYSLFDDSHSFADEAINTIVQEMENHREDVIVIFAGYPDKMKDFINKNEGLRSRIAFHLDFPDYSPDEMLEILKLMAKNRGFRIEKKALDKCLEIFDRTCREEDFGNGRFARNLIEQAEMAQARRISPKSRNGEISEKTLQTLIASDFDVNISKRVKESRAPIGFMV